MGPGYKRLFLLLPAAKRSLRFLFNFISVSTNKYSFKYNMFKLSGSVIDKGNIKFIIFVQSRNTDSGIKSAYSLSNFQMRNEHTNTYLTSSILYHR